ncbi:MAG: YihY/virulence factor BrkB family protein [Proteobacteria bacterium]|nr:MAG: YihY/virulence factor BrkB family protein [Pseudomonadota bacterium]
MILWKVFRQAVQGFIEHGDLSRGAAIAFYTVTSLALLLLIVIAIAGLAIGNDAARSGVIDEFAGLVGPDGADLIKSIVARSSDPASGAAATAFGAVMVIITASGIFGEMQTALNATWDVKPPDQPWWSLIRARAASLGLVAALGFVTMVSLAASAALSALGQEFAMRTPVANVVLPILNTGLSLAVFALLFAAIYKMLPDTPLRWRDVAIGALMTAALFTGGKSLIGWYLGQAAPGSTYGAAGALIVLLLWAYYSAQIFLLGAELTKAIADLRAPRASPGEAVARAA